jgi:3'-phosphoadenosine 5'-phosphosulfate (PAPS) 3'-phosphatase
MRCWRRRRRADRALLHPRSRITEKIWDQAAGSIIAEEAGRISDLSGRIATGAC